MERPELHEVATGGVEALTEDMILVAFHLLEEGIGVATEVGLEAMPLTEARR